MINAPYEKEFVFHDGKRAKNILELGEVIERMSDQEFQSFADPNKNDFANWVEYVLFDKKFSEKLRDAPSRDHAILLLKEKLRELQEEENSVTEAAMSTSKIKVLKQADSIIYTTPVDYTTPANVANDTTHSLKYIISESHKDEKKPKASARWFDFFKTDISKKKIEKAVVAQSDKSKPERELKAQEVENKSENMLWIVLYGLLIGLILLLLVYKFLIAK
jgi:thiol:disulfide interchange protein